MIAQVHLKVAAIKSSIYKYGQRNTDGSLRVYEWGQKNAPICEDLQYNDEPLSTHF
jgi:hypothetical protein